MEQYSFFGEQGALEALSSKGDPLIKLEGLVDFEGFRPMLEQACIKPAKGPGGAPRWDAVMMFKLLVVQRLYGLSDEQAEYQTTDRLSFRRFLGLGLCDSVPDSRTVWFYRETLSKTGVMEQAFNHYRDQLLAAGLITRAGSLVDATFVTVPRQRNTREENDQLKQGQTPTEWRTRRRAHKDPDARWTRKGPDTFFGYKNHLKVDRDSKLIVKYKVTSASVNDGAVAVELVDNTDNVLHGDCAYNRDLVRDHLRMLGVRACLQMKGSRHVRLTEEQHRINRWHSKTRVRVEHAFALIKNCIKLEHLRYIGRRRIASAVALGNLLHNALRLSQLRKLSAA